MINPAVRLTFVLAILLAGCLAFGWWQNAHGSVGGGISLAKTLWLFVAISGFLVIPVALWRTTKHRLWAWFAVGFAARALVELPLLLFTRAWRCEHGIAHDALMLGLLLFGYLTLSEEDRSSRCFVPILGALLLFEMLNAWLFSRVARPEEGVYFAGDEAAFRMINAITWGEIALAFPALAVWLYREAMR